MKKHAVPDTSSVTCYSSSRHLSFIALVWVTLYNFFLFTSLFNSCLCPLVKGAVPESRTSGCFHSQCIPKLRSAVDWGSNDSILVIQRSMKGNQSEGDSMGTDYGFFFIFSSFKTLICQINNKVHFIWRNIKVYFPWDRDSM